MPEFTFSCPSCGNGILCDSQWSGHQIACPTCQAPVIIPTEVAPTPPLANPNAAAAAAARARMAARTQGGPKSTGKIVSYVVIGLVSAAAFFYVMKRARSVDAVVAEKTTKAAKESGGGDLGHIAELYDVLDKTDPDKMREADTQRRMKEHNEGQARLAAQKLADAKAAEEAAKLAIGEWKMDIESAEIPSGRANGMLGGTNFLADTARIDRVGYAQVLTLRQGTGAAVQGEIFIYLSMTPNEAVTNRTWTITPDMAGKGVPQIIKRWKPNPRYGLTQKSYSTGYAMKLELGEPTEEGIVPGKVMLSLPDTEKSFVVGQFRAEHTALVQAYTRAKNARDMKEMMRQAGYR